MNVLSFDNKYVVHDHLLIGMLMCLHMDILVCMSDNYIVLVLPVHVRDVCESKLE